MTDMTQGFTQDNDPGDEMPEQVEQAPFSDVPETDEEIVALVRSILNEPPHYQGRLATGDPDMLLCGGFPFFYDSRVPDGQLWVLAPSDRTCVLVKLLVGP